MMLVLPAAVWIFLSFTGLRERLDFDTGENRTKHRIQENTPVNELPKELEAWINDRVPFRSVILAADRKLHAMMELPYSRKIEPFLLKYAMHKEGQEEPASGNAPENEAAKDHTEASAENPDYYPVKVRNGVILGREGWLFIDQEMMDYLGLNLPGITVLQEYRDAFGRLQKNAEARGMTFAAAAFPNKSRIYPEYMPSMEMSKAFRLQMIEDDLKKNSSVPFTYVCEEMLEGKSDGLLYYTLDTHWNYKGALIGLNEVYRLLNLPAIDSENLSYTEFEHVGDLTNILNSPSAETAELPLYKPEITAESTAGPEHDYGFHERGYSEYISDARDARTIVMIGDSYLVNLSEYVKKDFAHSYFVNRLFLDTVDPEIIRSADILVFAFCERNSTDEFGWYCLDGLSAAAEILE